MSITFSANISDDKIFNVSNSNGWSIQAFAGLEPSYVGEIEFDRFLWGVHQTYLGTEFFQSKIDAARELVEFAKSIGATKLYFG